MTAVSRIATIVFTALILSLPLNADDKKPAKDTKIFPYYKVDEKPTMIVSPRPIYPEFALEAGIEGQVMVKIVIDKIGNVESANIIKSIPTFDAAALKAIKRWKFKPAVHEGRTVNVNMVIPIQFKLDMDESHPAYCP